MSKKTTPGFNIGARNGLLEDKHLRKLGLAIWLYLWFIDRQTKNTDRVLGGRPITFDLVKASYTSLTPRTYRRWMDVIKAGGYIATLRTPYGLVVTINKAKKWRDVPKVAERCAKSGHSLDKSGTSNKTIQLDNTKTIQRGTPVFGPGYREAKKIAKKIKQKALSK